MAALLKPRDLSEYGITIACNESNDTLVALDIQGGPSAEIVGLR